VLVGAGVLIGAVNHYWFLDSIESAAERNNVALARVLSNVVWPKFETDVLTRQDSTEWRANLNREVASLIGHSSIVKVKLYRGDGTVAYSTDPTATEEDEEGEPENAVPVEAVAVEHDGEAGEVESESGEGGQSEADEGESGHSEANNGEAGHSEGDEGESGHSEHDEGEAGNSDGDEDASAHSGSDASEAGHGEGGEVEAGEAGGHNDGFASAVNGLVKSKIEFEHEIRIFERVIGDRHTVSSYIPIYDTDNPRRAVAVFEIYDDITTLLAQFRESEVRTGLFLGSVLLLLYATLVMMVMRSELIAKRHHEEGLRLADEAARADAASAAKSEFLANMSHELRTPLNAIVGFSEVMKDGVLGPLSPKPYADYARHIWVSASHLTDIIGTILDLSKIDAGKATVENSAVSLPDAVSLVCKMMQAKADSRGIALMSSVDQSIGPVVTDGVKLRQILLNLLSNAIKFTDRGGQVSLQVARAGDTVEFLIRDNGIGMNEAEIKIAMSPFGQIESPFSRMHEGTGLGLPLTQRLIALLGGQMEIRSEKGVGTLVRVALPIAAAVPAADTPAKPDTAPADVHAKAV